MADRRDGGPPSLLMVAAGGVGVLVVIAFVAAVALGARSRPAVPGDRLAVGRDEGTGSPTVLVPRCRDERVKEVELSSGGQLRWRITSRKGSIDERYVAGGPPPLGFREEVALEGAVAGPVTAAVVIDGDGPARRDEATVGEVPADGVAHGGATVSPGAFRARALAAAACPESRRALGPTTVLFTAGALLVVGTYGLLVTRWWRARGAG